MKSAIKLFGLFFCLLIILARGVGAEGIKSEKKFGLTGYLTIDTYSLYVDKVSSELLHNGPVIQPRLAVVSEPWGVYLSVGAYSTFKSFSQHSSNSLEYAIGLDKEIGKFRIDAGYGYSDIKRSKGDVHFFYTTVEY